MALAPSQSSELVSGPDSSAWPSLSQAPEQSNIRLLKFEEGSDADTISISLSVVSLTEAPTFAAVSYCWGTGSATRQIMCNGHKISVLPNLFAALNRLRSYAHKFFWIDAICIQQSNLVEKSHQVRIMGQIYRAAYEVLVWLGSDTQSEVAESLIKQIDKSYLDNKITYRTADNGSLSGENLAQLGLPPWSSRQDPELGPLFILYTRPWFTRVWVVQEMSFPRHVSVLYGHSSFTWRQMMHAYRALCVMECWQPYRDQMQQFNYRLDALDTTRRALGTGKRSILEILNDHRSAECSNPRDKIYALAGIMHEMTASKDRQALSIPIDYTLSVDQVYLDLAAMLLTRSASLDLLCYLRVAGLPQLPDLPSWAPDWRALTEWPRLWASYRQSRADESWQASGLSPVHYKLSGKALQLKVQRFSTITDVSDCMLKTEIEDLGAAPSSDIAATTAIAKTMKSRVEACPRAGAYPAGGTNKDAFLQALILGTRTKVDHGQGQENVATVLDYADEASQSRSDLEEHKLHGLEKDRTLTLGYYHRALRLDHKLACTFSGHYCNVPFDARPGDEILLCAGANFPLVARRTGGTEPLRFLLIGGCYVHGIMYGEAWDPESAEEVWFD